MESVDDGAVQGVFTDELEHATLQGIDLIVDENIARTGQREQQLEKVMKVQPAHTPGVVLTELNMKFDGSHFCAASFYADRLKICAKMGENKQGRVGAKRIISCKVTICKLFANITIEKRFGYR
jgi:hypothetical protein